MDPDRLGSEAQARVEQLEAEGHALTERLRVLQPVVGLCRDERWQGALLPMLQEVVAATERRLMEFEEPDWGAYRFLQGQREALRTLCGYPDSLIAEIRKIEGRIEAIARDLRALRSRS